MSTKSKLQFNNNFLLNYGIPTINYKSIHFVMDGKELNEEEIQNSFTDANNEISILYQN